MSNYDVAGLLKTYSEKCLHATSDERLKRFVRELKCELNSKEIAKMKIN